MTKFEFAIELRDNDTDSGIDTVVLSYKNPLLATVIGAGASSQPGASGAISFDVMYGV
jgi:hypothetical protein